MTDTAKRYVVVQWGSKWEVVDQDVNPDDGLPYLVMAVDSEGLARRTAKVMNEEADRALLNELGRVLKDAS